MTLFFLGDKSEVLDIDTPDLQLYPEFVKACRYECVLEPGDLLFIPGVHHITIKEFYTSQLKTTHTYKCAHILN